MLLVWYDFVLEKDVKCGFIGWVVQWFDYWFECVICVYCCLIEWVLNWCKIMLVIVVVVFVGGLMLFLLVGVEFVFVLDNFEVQVEMELFIGLLLDCIQIKIEQVDVILCGFLQVIGIYVMVNFGSSIGGDSVVIIIVWLVLLIECMMDFVEFSVLIWQVLEQVLGVIFCVGVGDSFGGGFVMLVELKIYGIDLNILKWLLGELVVEMEKLLGLVDVCILLDDLQFMLGVWVDCEVVFDLGVMLVQIGNVLFLMVVGEIVLEWIVFNGDSYDVVVWLFKDLCDDVGKLVSLFIVGMQDGQGVICLDQIVQIEVLESVGEIMCENCQCLVSIIVGLGDGVDICIIQFGLQVVQVVVVLLFGYGFVIGGDVEDIVKFGMLVLVVLGLVIVFIYLVLVL